MKKKKQSAGRPPFTRKIKVISVGVYEDQLPLSADEIRKAVDFYRFISPEKRAKIMEQ